jgi:hypothetical protein
MRKSLLMVAIPVSVLGLGLAGFMAVRMANKKAPSDDFAKQLAEADAAGIQLAQNQAAKQYALSETVPEAKPEPKTITKRAPSGAKAVRSNTPTVRAAREPVAADVVEEIPDLTVVAQSTGPTHTEASVPSTPEPSPATTPAPAQDQGPILRGGNGAGAGSGGSGTGMGTAIGVIFGSVIRGGAVDGDNCDLHRRPRPQTRTSSQPPYERPSGMAGARTGGWGGASATRGGATTIVTQGGAVATRPRTR